MSVVAVIPARGGSKGIPGKNLRLIGGVPLIMRSVDAALSCHLIDRVIVSTDDLDIADAARLAGAEIVDRPSHLAGDRATSESVVLHVLDRLHPVPQVVVLLQPTSPFIDSAALGEAIERVRCGADDVVFSAVETFAFVWAIGDGGATGVNHIPTSRPRRQDREAQYRETGAFYVMNAAGFRSARSRFFGRIGVSIVDERTAIEIDSLDQLELANAIVPLIDPVSALH